MFYIEEILNIEQRGDECYFDKNGTNITRHYFENKDEMIGFVLNNKFNFWNENSHIDLDDLEGNTHILPEIKFYKFDDVLVNVCKENGLSLDKISGNEIEETSFDMRAAFYDLMGNHNIYSMEKLKMMFEEVYLSSHSLLFILK